MIHKKNKYKGQISLEILAIIGMLVIGAIFLGTFYMSGLNKKTAEATAIEDPTDGMSKWVVDSNALGSTDPILISECGNGKVEGTEQCDGLDMGKYTYQTCASLKYSSGNLSCNADCTLDTSACIGGTTSSTCGNGTIQKYEQCDGINLNGKTCASLGYSGGNLTCKSNCSFDLTTCSNLYCGDRICNNGEDSVSCSEDCSDVPIANPPGSVYSTSQKVSLTSQTPGTIYYTTDGTIPTPSSKKYTGLISITTDTNLYAKSFTTSWTESALMVEEYILNEIATPVATPAGSAYLTPQTVSLTCLTPDTNIYYSIQYSGGETSVKTLYTSPILISSNATIQAQAYKSGFDPSEIMTEEYIINAIATPIAKPVGGAYTVPQTVTLSSITSGTLIYYTLDGSTPTTSSTLYSAPVAINSSTILKAIAVKSGYNPSEVMIENYTITGTVATPIASILTGTYTNNQTISLSTTTIGAEIYYTIDGSMPTIESPLYLSPINIKFNTNLKAIAVKNDFELSGILSETYTIIVAAPVASPVSGTSINSQAVSLSTETIGATIYYTTNGTTPTTASTVYSSPINLNATTTIKAVAYKLGYALSDVMSATYNINYILTYTAGPNGTISGTSPQTIVNYNGSGTPVTAVPNYNSHFVNWSDGSIANPRTDTLVTSNISVTANFSINTYTLTYTAGPNGTISGTALQTVNYGSNGSTVTAIPSSGYRFVNWNDGTTTASRTEINVTANKSVTANFAINVFTLTYTAGANGTINGTTPQTVNYGSGGSAVSGKPDSGYYFVNWSDGSTDNPRRDTDVTSNISVTATFNSNLYTITFDSAGGSAVSSITQKYGTKITAPTNPTRAGYTFSGWSPVLAATMPIGGQDLTAQWNGNNCTGTAWGTINNGSSVTAYASSLPSGACTSQTRTCTNGSLSGTYTSTTCTPGCTGTPWGTVASGFSGTAYSASTVAWNASCSSIAQTRTCTAGTMSGSYTHTSCSPATALNCTGTAWGTINNGSSVTAYASSLPSGACTSQTRTCTNGSLSGTYTSTSCTPGCTGTPWGSVASGYSNTAWASGTLTYSSSGSAITADICISENRKCTAGTMSGTYNYTSCIVNSYTITFNSAGGSAVSSITQKYGTTVTAPTNPTKAGYIFTGWSPALPATMPSGGLTVTAQWNSSSYLVTCTSTLGGVCSPSAVSVISGNTKVINLIPIVGYYVVSASGCGGSLSGNTFTTGPITSPCTINVSFAPIIPTCSSASANGSPITETTGLKRVYVYGLSDYSYNVQFYVWSSVNAQDDIYYYSGVREAGGTWGGGTWYADIDLAKHPDLGLINVHIYIYDAAGNPHANVCGTANFTRVAPTYTASTLVKSGKGSFSPSSRLVTSGSNTNFRVTPDPGYSISSISGCGGSLSSTTYFTTGPITSDCTVTANFEVKNLTYSGATHTELQCIKVGGEVVSTSGGTLCRFDSSSCSSGWTPADYWSTTTATCVNWTQPALNAFSKTCNITVNFPARPASSGTYCGMEHSWSNYGRNDLIWESVQSGCSVLTNNWGPLYTTQGLGCADPEIKVQGWQSYIFCAFDGINPWAAPYMAFCSAYSTGTCYAAAQNIGHVIYNPVPVRTQIGCK